jgi:hypothetical protein
VELILDDYYRLRRFSDRLLHNFVSSGRMRLDSLSICIFIGAIVNLVLDLMRVAAEGKARSL